MPMRIALAAGTSIGFQTHDVWQWAFVMVPLGALIGFPLDDLWHSTFGIDITMWSPTHLLMIGAASLMPIVLWLMLGEAIPERREARKVFAHTAGIVLIGLSTFQLEFDIGIP